MHALLVGPHLYEPSTSGHLLNSLRPYWAPGPVWMHWDRRDISMRMVKFQNEQVFDENVYFSLEIGAPSVTHLIVAPLIHEDRSRLVSTR